MACIINPNYRPIHYILTVITLPPVFKSILEAAFTASFDVAPHNIAPIATLAPEPIA